MKKIIMIAAAVAATAQCGAIDLAKENWKVPNWSTVVSAPGAVREFIGRTWSGHVQGTCVSSNAIYFSFHNQIVKTDWYGRLTRWVPVDIHGGDICYLDGKVYTGVWRKPKEKGEKWCAAIYMYDADTLKLLNVRKVPWDSGADGITALDGVVYLAMGARGKYDPVKKCGRQNWYCKFKAVTLEQIGEPFFVDHGEVPATRRRIRPTSSYTRRIPSRSLRNTAMGGTTASKSCRAERTVRCASPGASRPTGSTAARRRCCRCRASSSSES